MLGTGTLPLGPHPPGNRLMSPFPYLSLEKRDTFSDLMRRAPLACHAHFVFVG